MQICHDADLGTEYSFPQNQNITGKAPRLLPCSSIASCPDQGSQVVLYVPAQQRVETLYRNLYRQEGCDD